MAMMRLKVISLLVCFLAGLSYAEDGGTKGSKAQKSAKEKAYENQGFKDWTRYSGGSYPDWSKFWGGSYSDWPKYYGAAPSNWSTYFGSSSTDWSKYMGNNYPSSLGAGVSWGPFIPLGMPIPDPYFYSYYYGNRKGKFPDYDIEKENSKDSHGGDVRRAE